MQNCLCPSPESSSAGEGDICDGNCPASPLLSLAARRVQRLKTVGARSGRNRSQSRIPASPAPSQADVARRRGGDTGTGRVQAGMTRGLLEGPVNPGHFPWSHGAATSSRKVPTPTSGIHTNGTQEALLLNEALRPVRRASES